MTTTPWDIIDLVYFEPGYIVDGYIGDVPSLFDVRQTVISQYGNSPTLLRLIDAMNDALDPGYNFTQFYRTVWNIVTATGFGLDILGRIVNISRTITILTPLEYFGFEEGGDYQPFGQAPFYNGPADTDTYILADDAYRVLILVKAMANIAATDAPSLNRLLQTLFAGRGRCYVNDLGGMQMRFMFEFVLTPFELAVMSANEALPHPAGVQPYLTVIDPVGTFGFAEAGPQSQPFGQGTFLSAGASYAI